MSTRLLQFASLLMGSLFIFVACGKGKLRPLPEDRMGSLGRLAKVEMSKLENDSNRLKRVREVYFSDFDPSAEKNRALFEAIEGLTIEGVDVEKDGRATATDIKVHILLKAVEKTVVFSRRFSSENLKKTLTASQDNKDSGSPYDYSVVGICFDGCMYIYIMVSEARKQSDGKGISIGRADFLAKISGEGQSRKIEVVQPANIKTVEVAIAARAGQTTPESPEAPTTPTELTAQQKYEKCKQDDKAFENCADIITQFEADGMAQMCAAIDLTTLINEPKCWESRKELFAEPTDALEKLRLKGQACDADRARAEALSFRCDEIAEQVALLERRTRCEQLKANDEEAWKNDGDCQSLEGGAPTTAVVEGGDRTEITDEAPAPAGDAEKDHLDDCMTNPVKDINQCYTAFLNGPAGGDEAEAKKLFRQLADTFCKGLTGDSKAQWGSQCDAFDADERFKDAGTAPEVTADDLAGDVKDEDACESNIGVDGYQIPAAAKDAIFKNMEACQIESRGWNSINDQVCMEQDMERCNMNAYVGDGGGI